MTRFVPVTVLVMMASSRVASADSGSLPNGATLTFDKLYIHEDGNPNLEEPDVVPDSLWNYFNLSHCQCSKSPPSGFLETEFAYLMTLQSQAAPLTTDRELQFWVGLQCDSTDPQIRDANCHQVTSATVGSINGMLQSAPTVKIPLYDFMTPVRASPQDMPECTPTEQDGTLWAIAAIAQGGSAYDFFQSKTLRIDSKAPDLPTDFRGSGGDGAIELSWTPPISTLDVYVYQALCARADAENNDTPGRSSGQPERRYQTAATLCGLDIAFDLPGSPLRGGDASDTPVALPDGLKNLEPRFLCGETRNPAATGLRIDGLENNVPYKIVLLTVDKFQNAKGTFFTSTVTPVPSIDFWEDIHDRGSRAEGGLCLLAETYGNGSALTTALRSFRDNTLARSRLGRWLSDLYYATIASLGVYVQGSIVVQVIAAVALAPLVALALLWHWLTLPGMLGLIALVWLWRRRRVVRVWLPRVAIAGAVAIVALAPGPAHAQGYQPYWENPNIKGDEEQTPPGDPSLVKWHVGARVGPYIPDIDSQVGGTDPGPYEQMFGGYQVLPMLDVDRILWTGMGQVGVGLSLGYMQKTARTFTLDSMPDAGDRARAADRNKFRLIPMALTATYRLTYLDDEYGIPVVPYARGGLAYYLWWVSVSGGNLAKVCNDGGMQPDCSQNKALGGSLGLQGSIGLAIRAERIDASTAMSMQQSGIQHAGIYAELSLAKVDGFGSETKLSVGDTTWFAGVNFEF